MDITYLGDSLYKIQGKKVSIILESGKIEFDGEKRKVLDGPGEYEVSGVSVFGTSVEGGVFYSLEVDNVRVGYTTSSEKKITESQSGLIGDIDVLILPLGEAEGAIISEFEPRYVVPAGLDEGECDDFAKKLGFRIESLGKLSIKQDKESLPSNDQIVVFLAKKSK